MYAQKIANFAIDNKCSNGNQEFLGDYLHFL
jgi:hypothetical protein